MTFAAQGAIAIRNANLMQQLELRTRELARSVDQLEGLQQGRRGGELEPRSRTRCCRRSWRTPCELSGTEGGSIFEFDDEAEEFEIRTAYGTSEELLAALRATRSACTIRSSAARR